MKRVVVVLVALAMAMPCRAEENVIAVIHQDRGMNNAVSIEEPCPAESESDVELADAPAINDISSALDEVDANGHHMEYLGQFSITYYCRCKRCNGRWGAVDGYGNPLRWGTVAVDKRVIPMGTQLVIDGYDAVFTARDTGSGVRGNHIDVYVPVSHSEALAMGQGERRKVWLYK